MSLLPRVTVSTRERIAREFDDLGPDACIAEILHRLKQDNPELLDMASKCAADVGNSSKIIIGLGMFYRLLDAQASGVNGKSILSPLPRVTPEARDILVRGLDEEGSEAFTMRIIQDLSKNNPELLQMAHYFASGTKRYLSVMQGFALLYESLVVQTTLERSFMH
jgi:hypothetical protein